MRLPAIAVLVLVTGLSPSAQQVSRTADRPIVTAENESWYLFGEPLAVAGDVYQRSGPPVFFDGNTMVRTGHYNGVPLYADATREPYSAILVPVARGLMQPYSRVNPTPAQTSTARGIGMPMAASVPTTAAASLGDIDRLAAEPGAVATAGRIDAPPQAAATTGLASPRLRSVSVPAAAMAAARAGIWIDYLGEKWVGAGPAVPLRAGEFTRVGEYAGHAVFTRAGLQEDVIYLPTLAGKVTPYRLAE